MEILKRNGSKEQYDSGKIAVAIGKSFRSTGRDADMGLIGPMVQEVEDAVYRDESLRSVEKIQDEVEKVLMAHGFFAEAKNYILYRCTRTEKRRSLSSILRHFGDGDDAPDGGQGHLCGGVRTEPALRK